MKKNVNENEKQTVEEVDNDNLEKDEKKEDLKPKKKHTGFNYNPKFFGFGDNKNKNDKKSEKNEEDGEKDSNKNKDENKKEDFQAKFQNNFKLENLKNNPLAWAALGFSVLAISKLSYDYLNQAESITYVVN